VVDHDHLGRADPRPRPLVEAALAVAAPPGAGRGVGVHVLPHLGARGRLQVVPQAGLGRVRPVGDPLQLGIARVVEQARPLGQGVGEPGRAEVVRLPDEDRRHERGVPGELGRRAEQPPAERQVLLLDLLLERDRVGRDDELPPAVGRMDDSRHEVGEGLADARPASKRRGSSSRKAAAPRWPSAPGPAGARGPGSPAATRLGEGLRGELGRPAWGRLCGGCLVLESDHRGLPANKRMPPPANGICAPGLSPRSRRGRPRGPRRTAR
jgi:hypothetical protein